MDLGCKQAGYISVDELSADPSVKPEDVVKVGDEIETYIIRVNDVEGYAMLSKKRLDAVKVWEEIEEARENKTTLEGKVTEENKGGIVVNVKGVRVFVPASQTGQPRGADLSEMIGQTVSLRITEVNRARRRVVGSIRAVQYEARQAAQAAIWESIEVGKHYTGTVKSMTSPTACSWTSAAWTAWYISPSCPGPASRIPPRSSPWATRWMSMSSPSTPRSTRSPSA